MKANDWGKLDNDTEQVIRAIAKVISSVKPCQGARWHDRVVLGCWAVSVVQITHIQDCEKLIWAFSDTLSAVLCFALARLLLNPYRLPAKLRSLVLAHTGVLLYHAPSDAHGTARS